MKLKKKYLSPICAHLIEADVPDLADFAHHWSVRRMFAIKNESFAVVGRISPEQIGEHWIVIEFFVCLWLLKMRLKALFSKILQKPPPED